MFKATKKIKQGKLVGGIDWKGGVSGNENPHELSGFKPNDGAVDMYGGVPSNDNKYEKAGVGSK